MRFCQACGARIEENSCAFCGAVQTGGAQPKGRFGGAGSSPNRASSSRTTTTTTTTTTYVRPHVPGASTDQPASRDATPWIVGGLIVVALVGLVIYVVSADVLRGEASEVGTGSGVSTSMAPGAESPNETTPQAPEETPSESPVEYPTESPTDAESEAELSPEESRAEAIDDLEGIVDADRASVPIRDQWVAQLASKYEGITDTTQQAEPFSVEQILDEVQVARSNPDFGSLVRVVHQGDWGQSQAGPETMWVTFADIDAGSR